MLRLVLALEKLGIQLTKDRLDRVRLGYGTEQTTIADQLDDTDLSLVFPLQQRSIFGDARQQIVYDVVLFHDCILLAVVLVKAVVHVEISIFAQEYLDEQLLFIGQEILTNDPFLMICQLGFKCVW